ncbi:hypothetical protein GY45DRAFT_1245317 [Cubamyces sp. BRFM 1775]|nr:hypothetical protein GY45DRAFT_1245317 [Cubamyces sp. BRFM 1775]
MQDLLLMYYAPYLLGYLGFPWKPLSSDNVRSRACGSQHTSNLATPCATNNTATAAQHPSRSPSVLSSATSSSIYSSMMSSDSDDMSSSSSTSMTTAEDVPLARIPLPLPHAVKQDPAHTVEFRSANGSRGVSLAEWIRLSERRISDLCLENPEESLEEVILEKRILYQCQWPGYDVDTCYIPTPSHVADGLAPLRKADLLDIICERLSHWVLQTIQCRQIECKEPQWALGLDQITFEHIYVVSVVEVKGYTCKWVPVIEIDADAMGRCEVPTFSS